MNRFSPRTAKTLPPGLHADGGGLYLQVDESGARRWVLRTTVQGRRRELGLGGFDDLPLAEAREVARRLRRVARAGGDPAAERDRGKGAGGPTFADAARIVHREQIVPTAKNGKHVTQWIRTMELYAFPTIGDRPVSGLAQADMLRVLSPIWTETPETARRVRQRLRMVMDWARASGHFEGQNPVDGVEAGLARRRRRAEHFAALPYADLPELWKRLVAAGGLGALALRFAILTAARSGEVRGATWPEIDLEAAIWSVPADRMKSGREHRVPLSAPAVAILHEVRPLAFGPGARVFAMHPKRGLSENTLAAVLKRLEVPVTAHGFRSTFRDWVEEQTHTPRAVAEAALAHAVADKVEAAYRRTDLFAKRVALMQEWGQFVTGAAT